MVAEEAILSAFVQNAGSESSPPVVKKKRNLPGNPDPEAEVIALSPKTLMATNRFVCEICGKGFQRDQNLQLHRRGHNLPWKLKQRANKDVIRKRVYVCPEKTCVHHHPARALGDLTGIKKHFCRKHGEKKFKCDKCSKRYAVQSDWKAHSKTCGTKEYRCDCGSIFSRRDSFITHRAFCDALAEETARLTATSHLSSLGSSNHLNYNLAAATPLLLGPNVSQHFSSMFKPIASNYNDTMDQTRPGSLSLWMSQGHQSHEATGSNNASIQHIHQIGSLNSGSLLFGSDPLVSCSNPASSDNLHQLNWVFGTKLSSSAPQELMTNPSLPMSCNANKEVGTQQVSVPSLYSTQQLNTHQTPSASAANTSATALLQKAAQIGATSADPSFIMSFRAKASNTNTNHVQDGSKYYDVYGSNSLVTSLGSDRDTENSTNEISTLNQLQMQRAKRQRVENGGGETRDFLGVGVQAMCHPSSVSGWI